MKTKEILLQPNTILERVNNTVLQQHADNGIRIQRMLPGEATGLTILCNVYSTAIGEVLLASAPQGICYAGFTDNNSDIAIADLRRRFPKATISIAGHPYHEEALQWFNRLGEAGLPLHLHVKATTFQWFIWQKLLCIPMGGLVTYAALGGSRQMARAAGAAVGDNPVCFLIPCHRAVRSNGRFEDYFWGPERKKELLIMEAAPQEAGF